MPTVWRSVDREAERLYDELNSVMSRYITAAEPDDSEAELKRAQDYIVARNACSGLTRRYRKSKRFRRLLWDYSEIQANIIRVQYNYATPEESRMVGETDRYRAREAVTMFYQNKGRDLAKRMLEESRIKQNV